MLDWRNSYSALKRSQQPALASQLRSVWQRSAFYRDIWRAMPDPERFQELPLITKADLHRALGSGFMGSNGACPPEDLVHIHASSGTSGRPTYFGLTQRDYDAWIRTFTRGFDLAGVRRGDRVLHAFAMSRGYAGGVPMIEAFEAMGCVPLPMGAEAGSLRLVDAVERLEPAVLYASPSMARRLASAFADQTGRPAAESAVRLVLTGGEPGAGDPSSKRQLAESWGAEVRECGGGTDVCPLMVMECPAHNGLHFIAGDDVLFELVEPATGRLLPLEGQVEGEIVYTHLFRDANPVVRMRHGDVVEVNTASCSCGLEAPRLWFRGRSDDMLIVRGVKLYPSSIQSIVSQFAPDLTGMFAVRQPRPEVSDDALSVVCECSRDPADAEQVRTRFEEWARQALGVRVHCKLVEKGSLDRDPSGKVKWVVTDE